MAASCRQECLHGSLRIQAGRRETPLRSQTQEGHREKAGPLTAGRPAHEPRSLEAAPPHCAVSSPSPVHGPTMNLDLPPTEATLIQVPSNRSPTLDSTTVPATVLLCCSVKAILPAPGPARQLAAACSGTQPKPRPGMTLVRGLPTVNRPADKRQPQPRRTGALGHFCEAGDSAAQGLQQPKPVYEDQN